ncbi:MAG: hypothetical protein GC180_12320 [Bacteroidetes bacterium]|nr:hypothetical protein [Bacteroidota bacterium]
MRTLLIALGVFLFVLGCKKESSPDNNGNGTNNFPSSGIIYQNSGMWVMNPDGSNKREIASVTGMANSLSSSPDGSKFVYHRFGTGIVVLSKEGEKVVLKDDLVPNQSNVTWSKDGHLYLSYYKANTLGGQYIFRVNADGSGLSQITPDFSDPVVTTPYDDMPSVAPDNSALLFTSQRSGNMAVLNKMDMSTKKISYLTWPDGTNGSGTMGLYAAECPTWSPDGSKILVAAYTDNLLPQAEQSHAQLFVMNPDGSNPTALTHFTIERARYPAWSPDGSQIVFEKDSMFYTKICVMNADGSGLKVLGSGQYPCYIGQPR